MTADQTGKAGELFFSALTIVGGGGLIEIVPPLADDERRDFELHLKDHFGTPLSIQVKVHAVLVRGRLHITIGRATSHPSPMDPAFWYFVAHLDVKKMELSEPMFLIPSVALRTPRGELRSILLSLSKTSADRWVRYRVNRQELGPRLVAILRDLSARKKGMTA